MSERVLAAAVALLGVTAAPAEGQGLPREVDSAAAANSILAAECRGLIDNEMREEIARLRADGHLPPPLSEDADCAAFRLWVAKLHSAQGFQCAFADGLRMTIAVQRERTGGFRATIYGNAGVNPNVLLWEGRAATTFSEMLPTGTANILTVYAIAVTANTQRPLTPPELLAVYSRHTWFAVTGDDDPVESQTRGACSVLEGQK